ncbi:MAG: DUF3108 domain-containing protein [Reichenbachiella sp.]
MKYFILTISLLLVCQKSSFGIDGDMSKKEEMRLEYKLKLGWFTLGSGTVRIQEDAMTIKGRNHHQVYAHTSTLGLGNWLSNLDDEYTALVDNESSKSYYSYKNVVVGKEKWEQWNNFDYDSLRIKVKVKDYRREDPNRTWEVDINEDTYDVLGTFLYFKSYDWSKAILNDSTIIDTFYEKKLYKVGVEYMGDETIKFNGESVAVHRLHLLLPEHENVRKDRPVIIWLSKDENRIPIRIQTSLGIGNARCELQTINNSEPVFKSY